MKINELRVGNYIYYCDEIYKVDLRCIYNHMDDEQDDAYQPIPLTEELFVKCGFELKDNNYTIKIDGWLSIGIDKDDNSVLLGDSFESGVAPSLNILYLHQLQNLYYALTNDELRYNP
jgi:hypothetical protein